MKNEVEEEEEPKNETGFWNGIKQTMGKVWETVKENPWKALATGVALALPPVGTAIAASVIAGVVGKKAYETYKEQNPSATDTPKPKAATVASPAKKGFWNGIKQTMGKVWETAKANPWKSLAAVVALAIPPVGSAIGEIAIAGVVGKKAHETYKEQEAQKATTKSVQSNTTQQNTRSSTSHLSPAIASPPHTPPVHSTALSHKNQQGRR